MDFTACRVASQFPHIITQQIRKQLALMSQRIENYVFITSFMFCDNNRSNAMHRRRCSTFQIVRNSDGLGDLSRKLFRIAVNTQTTHSLAGDTHTYTQIICLVASFHRRSPFQLPGTRLISRPKRPRKVK